MGIHPSAVIDESAVIAKTASVGPYAVIGPGVTVGDGTVILSHAVIERDTSIGRNCKIHPFSSLGADPQDMKYQGESTRLEIGDRVIVRESATVHRGTAGGGGVTRIGDGCLIMATCHVAHDCQIAEEVILSSFAVLAGHVELGKGAVVSGSSAVHQFVKVGPYAFIGGMSGVVKDVPPFMIVAGVRDKMLVAPNLVGLKRRGFPPEALEVITGAHRLLRNHRPLEEVLREIEERYPASKEAERIVEFYRSSERGVYR
ncbi:MAG: acyl-ACP--UDP-N-acetylglucosamine O-acyltransferase [Deltaproteobacteria bacterium]|jgi:UDP-N-acetylglucosamine acyltransferase|nr:acyl-ACP--UDP-N-acetylglucosamine O-acyltransferase [Deltaproteobacteria bacterium]